MLIHTFIGHLLYVRHWEWADKWPSLGPGRICLLLLRKMADKQSWCRVVDRCSAKAKTGVGVGVHPGMPLWRRCCLKGIIRTCFSLSGFSLSFFCSLLCHSLMDWLHFLYSPSHKRGIYRVYFYYLGGYTNIFNTHTWLQAKVNQQLKELLNNTKP